MLQDLDSVLTTGNDAGGHDIVNAGTISGSAFSGDGSALTGIAVPTLAQVLAAGNDAGGMDIVNLGGLTGSGGLSFDTCDVNHGRTEVDAEFFGVTAVGQQPGGPQVAGVLWTATEQDMLQKAYDALRGFGFIVP